MSRYVFIVQNVPLCKTKSFLGQLLTYNRPCYSLLVGGSNSVTFRIKFSCVVENREKMFSCLKMAVISWILGDSTSFQRMFCRICPALD